MNTQIKWELFVNKVAENKVELENAIQSYDNNPFLIREKMAELGVEETPDELKKLINLIQMALKEC